MLCIFDVYEMKFMKATCFQTAYCLKCAVCKEDKNN